MEKPHRLSGATRSFLAEAACILLALSWLAAPAAVAAEKTDVVVLKNGDHLTGEVKQLKRGLLSFKTDALGTVEIEWREVARLRTRQLLEVVQMDGNLRHGHLTEDAPTGTLVLASDDSDAGRAPMAMDSIVNITPITEGSFGKRLDGHVSVGLSAKSANDDREVTVATDVSYRDTRQGWSVDYKGARSESANNPSFERHDLNGMHQRFLSDTRYWGSIASLTTNDELELNMRALVGTGMGRYWLRDQSHELSTLLGLAVTRESYRGDPAEGGVELVLQARYDFFHFDKPDIDLSAEARLFPSLTVGGRVRSEVGISARMELVKDLYYELSFNHSQDNKPPTDTARQTDWSLNSSLGFKF